MKKEFVTYELALRLKALGFDEVCMAYWRKPGQLNFFDMKALVGQNQDIRKLSYVKAPTWQSAFDWFEEKYGIDSFVERIFRDEYGYTISEGENEPINGFNINSRIEAKQECLEALCEIVEKQKENENNK